MELTEIFVNKVHSARYELSEEARNAIQTYFARIYIHRDQHFGNAREVGNFFEKVKAAHNNRIATFDLDNPDFDNNLLCKLTEEDIINAQ